jgi:hypothetical protein
MDSLWMMVPIFRYPSLTLPLSGDIPGHPNFSFVDQLLPSLKLDIIHAHHPILLSDQRGRRQNSTSRSCYIPHSTGSTRTTFHSQETSRLHKERFIIG